MDNKSYIYSNNNWRDLYCKLLLNMEREKMNHCPSVSLSLSLSLSASLSASIYPSLCVFSCVSLLSLPLSISLSFLCKHMCWDYERETDKERETQSCNGDIGNGLYDDITWSLWINQSSSVYADCITGTFLTGNEDFLFTQIIFVHRFHHCCEDTQELMLMEKRNLPCCHFIICNNRTTVISPA